MQRKSDIVVRDAGEPYETSPIPNPGRKGETGFLVGGGQSSSGAIAPTLPISIAPTSGGRSVPEVGGESAFGMNAEPEKSRVISEYRPSRPSNLPETISTRQIADAGAAFVDGRDGNCGWGAK